MSACVPNAAPFPAAYAMTIGVEFAVRTTYTRAGPTRLQVWSHNRFFFYPLPPPHT